MSSIFKRRTWFNWCKWNNATQKIKIELPTRLCEAAPAEHSGKLGSWEQEWHEDMDLLIINVTLQNSRVHLYIEIASIIVRWMRPVKIFGILPFPNPRLCLYAKWSLLLCLIFLTSIVLLEKIQSIQLSKIKASIMTSWFDRISWLGYTYFETCIGTSGNHVVCGVRPPLTASPYRIEHLNLGSKTTIYVWRQWTCIIKDIYWTNISYHNVV